MPKQLTKEEKTLAEAQITKVLMKGLKVTLKDWPSSYYLYFCKERGYIIDETKLKYNIKDMSDKSFRQILDGKIIATKKEKSFPIKYN